MNRAVQLADAVEIVVGPETIGVAVQVVRDLDIWDPPVRHLSEVVLAHLFDCLRVVPLGLAAAVAYRLGLPHAVGRGIDDPQIPVVLFLPLAGVGVPNFLWVHVADFKLDQLARVRWVERGEAPSPVERFEHDLSADQFEADHRSPHGSAHVAREQHRGPQPICVRYRLHPTLSVGVARNFPGRRRLLAEQQSGEARYHQVTQVTGHARAAVPHRQRFELAECVLVSRRESGRRDDTRTRDVICVLAPVPVRRAVIVLRGPEIAVEAVQLELARAEPEPTDLI